ncbi:unnamed protein product, partial [Gulo gulo]
GHPAGQRGRCCWAPAVRTRPWPWGASRHLRGRSGSPEWAAAAAAATDSSWLSAGPASPAIPPGRRSPSLLWSLGLCPSPVEAAEVYGAEIWYPDRQPIPGCGERKLPQGSGGPQRPPPGSEPWARSSRGASSRWRCGSRHCGRPSGSCRGLSRGGLHG